MTYPKDTATDLYFYMRNGSGFPVDGMNSQTLHLCKQGGVPYVPSGAITEVWDGVNASTKIGLYKLAASATDMNTEGQLSLTSKQGAYYGQAVFEVSDPLKQIKAALSGSGTLPTVNLKTLSIYNSSGVAMSIGGLFPLAISASIGSNPAIEITAPQSPVITVNNSTNGLTQNFPNCTL